MRIRKLILTRGKGNAEPGLISTGKEPDLSPAVCLPFNMFGPNANVGLRKGAHSGDKWLVIGVVEIEATTRHG